MSAAQWIDTYVMRNASLRAVILFTFHLFVFVGAYALAWLIRFDFTIPPVHVPAFQASLPFVVGIQLIAGFGFGFYRGWWRYVGLTDVVRQAMGLTLALLVILAIWFADDAMRAGGPFVGVSRGALLIDWAFALLFLFGTRIVVRVGRDRSRAVDVTAVRKRVLVVGAGDAGESLVREIQHRPQLGMTVAAFVDDHAGKWGSQIRGVPVKGPISNLSHIARETDSEEVLLAIPSAGGSKLREIVNHLASAGLRFRTIPGLDQLVSGSVNLSLLRPVNVDDLLRREEIELPGDPVKNLLKGRRVLVTGAGGTIGTELSRQILQHDPALLLLVDRSELALYELEKTLRAEFEDSTHRTATSLCSVGDESLMRNLLDEHQPEIVLHAAAHKHVPMGERNAWEYFRNNSLEALDLASLCEGSSVKRFVYISTDKAINPTSIMGATKRAGEILLIDLSAKSSVDISIVRFGNVIGSSGSVIPLFMEQIKRGGPVTVTHPDVTRYFLRTSEAVALVLQAASFPETGRVYMLDMGEPIRIVDLARDLIHLSDSSENEIEITYTGLRPGEKLYEEIRLDGEHTHPTTHPQIAVTVAPQPPTTEIAHWLYRSRTTQDRTRTHVVELLRDLVPEYNPKENFENDDSSRIEPDDRAIDLPERAQSRA